MKLSYLANARIPSRAANGVQTARMCRAFAKNGHRVELICRAGDDVGDVFAYYGIEPCFAFRPIPPRGPRGTHTALHLWAAREHVRRHRPDLVFGRDLFALAAVASMGAPLVFEVHRTMEGRRVEQEVFRWLVRQPMFRRFIVVSDGMRLAYQRDFPELPPERVLVLPGAADEPATASPAALPGRPHALQVGYVGHLYRGRGVELLVDAARAAPEVELHIVGGNEDDVARWRATARPDNVHIHGFVAPALVPGLLAAFDVLVAPYQRAVFVDGGAETSAVMSPLKLFEYMAAGKAMVVSDMPVLREVLDDTVALLVDPESAPAWAAALRALHNDRARARALGEQAQLRFRQRHTWQGRARKAIDGIAGS